MLYHICDLHIFSSSPFLVFQFHNSVNQYILGDNLNFYSECSMPNVGCTCKLQEQRNIKCVLT